MTEQNRKWSESPIHDIIREAGLDEPDEAQALSDPSASRSYFVMCREVGEVNRWKQFCGPFYTLKDALDWRQLQPNRDALRIMVRHDYYLPENAERSRAEGVE